MVSRVLDELEDTAQFILDPSLVLYLPLWKKDCLTAGVISSEDGYGHLCTKTGAIWGIQGWTFDGTDDKIVIPNATALNQSGSFAIWFWVKPTNFVGYRQLIDKRVDGGVINYFLYLSITTGKPVFVISDGTNVPQITASNNLTAATWYFIVAQRNVVLDQIELYVNAVSAATPVNDTTTGAITNTLNVWIGLRQDSANDYLGIIGEAGMYSRVLSANEIMNLYLATKWRYN